MEHRAIAIINGENMVIKKYRDIPVVTFKDIDHLHDRVAGTAKRNFIDNRKYFVEGEDFFVVSKKELGTDFVPTYGFDSHSPSGTLITESGYLMLCKSMTDKLSWEIQKALVKSYFRANRDTVVSTTMMQDMMKMISNTSNEIKYILNKLNEIGAENTILKQTIENLQMPAPTQPRINWVDETFKKVREVSLSRNVRDRDIYAEILAKMKDVDIDKMRNDYGKRTGKYDHVPLLRILCSENEVRERFESLLDEIHASIFNKKPSKPAEPVQETKSLPKIDNRPLYEIIKPLIEIRKDGTPHGTATARIIYRDMEKLHGVNWEEEMHKYSEKYARKRGIRKAQIVESNPQLRDLFCTVADNLLQFYQQSVDSTRNL